MYLPASSIRKRAASGDLKILENFAALEAGTGKEEGKSCLQNELFPCLDVNNGRVVKGVNFVDLKDAGDPVEIAKAYDAAGADELVFLDITASCEERDTVVDMVRKVAANVFIPFTVGGGIRTVDDFQETSP